MRLTLNTGLQVASRLLELGSGIAVNALLARRWGSAVFGQIGFVSGIAGLCSSAFDLGLGFLLMHLCAREPEKARSYVARGLAALLPLSVAGTACVVGIGLAASSPAYVPALLLVALLMILTAASHIFCGVFYAFERMELECASVALERIAYVAGGIWLAGQPPSLSAVFALLAACKALNVVVSAIAFLAAIPRGDREHLGMGDTWRLMRRSIPYGLNMTFSTLYVTADIVILQAMVGGAEVGHYRAASMLIVPLVWLAVSLNNAVFPRMNAATTDRATRVGHYTSFSARVVTAVGVPLALFFALFAPGIVSLLYGPEYGPAVLLLQLLALAIPLRFLNSTLATALTAYDQQHWRTACAGIAAGCNLALNAVFISRWHAFGACISTLVTDALIVGLLYLRARRSLGAGRLAAPRALGSLAAAGAILLPLALVHAPVLASGLIFAISYPLLVVRLGIISPMDVKLIAGKAER